MLSRRANAPVQTVHADFPHTAYRWPVGSQHYAASCFQKSCTGEGRSMPSWGSHAPGGARTSHGNATAPVPAWLRPKLPSQLWRFGMSLMAQGVPRSGLAGQSLTLTRYCSITTAGTLPSSRVMPHGLRRCGLRPIVQYYCPLGLPLRTARLRHWLIRARLPRPGPRRRASHVPHMSLHACCSPYPAAASRTLRYSLAWCCLRRDMSGSAYGL